MKKIDDLLSVYEDYQESIRTDYVTKLAFLVGIVAILIPLLSNLLFRIWSPKAAFWTTLLVTLFIILKEIFQKIIPLSNDHRKLLKIKHKLKIINLYTKKLNKTQHTVLDDMWKEVQIVSDYPKRFKNKNWEIYLSKIESWTNKLNKLSNSK